MRFRETKKEARAWWAFIRRGNRIAHLGYSELYGGFIAGYRAGQRQQPDPPPRPKQKRRRK